MCMASIHAAGAMDFKKYFMRFALVPPVRFTFLTCNSRTPSEAAGAHIYKAPDGDNAETLYFDRNSYVCKGGADN